MSNPASTVTMREARRALDDRDGETVRHLVRRLSLGRTTLPSDVGTLLVTGMLTCIDPEDRNDCITALLEHPDLDMDQALRVVQSLQGAELTLAWRSLVNQGRFWRHPDLAIGLAGFLHEYYGHLPAHRFRPSAFAPEDARIMLRTLHGTVPRVWLGLVTNELAGRAADLLDTDDLAELCQNPDPAVRAQAVTMAARVTPSTAPRR